ncbi:TPA: MAE_28990/MAE_18760 family HEPN-like nuclease [Photobacterium damselae]
MATFLSEFTKELDMRWEEVDLLIDQCEKAEDSNPKLYSALSRSISVLIVAHLEGFIKDLAKAVVHDINQHRNFSQLTTGIQRTYCRKFLGNKDNISGNYQFYVGQLIQKFSESQCSISHEPYLSSDNKNPKPDVLKTVLNNFGINNLFSNIKESDFDEVFADMSLVEIKNNSELAKDILIEDLESFPYLSKLETFKLETVNVSNSERTLCQTFLDEINQKRHEVAHGNIFHNSESPNVLRKRRFTVYYLQLMLIVIISTARLVQD